MEWCLPLPRNTKINVDATWLSNDLLYELVGFLGTTDGAFALLADPISATMFVRAWADTTLLGGKIISPPCFQPLPPQRPNIHRNPYTNLINHYKYLMNQKDPISALNHSTITLAFKHDMVLDCMAMAMEPSPQGGLILTPFESLVVLFWICLSRAKGVKCGLLNIILCSDMRERLGLDKGFFGNCMVSNKVQGENIAENDDLLSKATTAIRDVVDKMDREGIMDLIEWLDYNDHNQNPKVLNGSNQIIFANLGDTGSYEAVFEKGFRPIRTSYYIEPVRGAGQVLIMPSSDSEGSCSRLVRVTLPEIEVAKLLEDSLLLQFSPTIL